MQWQSSIWLSGDMPRSIQITSTSSQLRASSETRLRDAPKLACKSISLQAYIPDDHHWSSGVRLIFLRRIDPQVVVERRGHVVRGKFSFGRPSAILIAGCNY